MNNIFKKQSYEWFYAYIYMSHKCVWFHLTLIASLKALFSNRVTSWVGLQPMNFRGHNSVHNTEVSLEFREDFPLRIHSLRQRITHLSTLSAHPHVELQPFPDRMKDPHSRYLKGRTLTQIFHIIFSVGGFQSFILKNVFGNQNLCDPLWRNVSTQNDSLVHP